MYQYLKDLCNSVNQCFSSDHSIVLWNHIWFKIHSMCKMDQCVFMCKSMEVHSYGFRFHITIGLYETTPAKFWCGIKEVHTQLSDKVIKIISFFQLHICVKLNFFVYFNQNKISQHWMQLQIGESSCLPLSQTLQKFPKM